MTLQVKREADAAFESIRADKICSRLAKASRPQILVVIEGTAGEQI